jgi:hypothetical protein
VGSFEMPIDSQAEGKFAYVSSSSLPLYILGMWRNSELHFDSLREFSVNGYPIQFKLQGLPDPPLSAARTRTDVSFARNNFWKSSSLSLIDLP